MKISIYELLGMIKDGKAPKKIKYDNIIFEYDGIYYMTEHTYLDEYCDISRCLNDTVEILEEEKKIPEKIDISNFPKHNNSLKKTAIKLNEVIHYLQYLKRKGDE